MQPNNLVTEEEEYGTEVSFEGEDALPKKRRVKKKKGVVQVYNDPSDKDIQMAKAYGGVARGAPKRLAAKTIYRDSSTPLNHRGSRAQIASGTVSGMQATPMIQGIQSLQ